MKNFMLRTRQQSVSPLRIGLAGIHESGKTHAALKIAYELAGRDWGKVGIIMTEPNGYELMPWVQSANNTINFIAEYPDEKTRYATDHFIEAIKFLEKKGFVVIVIDSVSEFWSGQGGLFDYQKNDPTSTAQKHGEIKDRASKLYEAIKDSPCHIICTLKGRDKATAFTTKKEKEQMQEPIDLDVKDSFLFILNLLLVLENRQVVKAYKDKFGKYATYKGQIDEEFCEGLHKNWLAAKGISTQPTPEVLITPQPAKDNANIVAWLRSKISTFQTLEEINTFAESQREHLGSVECENEINLRKRQILIPLIPSYSLDELRKLASSEKWVKSDKQLHGLCVARQNELGNQAKQ